MALKSSSVTDFDDKLARVIQRFTNDAADVDRANVVPREHFDLLADLGLYGAFAPESYGGLGLSLQELCGVAEELSGACLASTFVWIQHLRLLASVLDSAAPAPVADMRSKVMSGEIKGGVALAGLLSGPPRLTAIPTPHGWALSGSAPWVSGWGLVDELFIAARGPDDTVVNVLVKPKVQPGLSATRHEMTAINATATVALAFDSLEVDEERVVSQVTYDPLQEAGPGLRLNGSLSLGVARRCCDLMGESTLDNELRDARAFLDSADGATMARARAQASELAARAASALCVFRGSSSILQGDIAERTNREATLLLAFGSRPAIRSALLERLISDVAGPR
jgi:alkylation response protein AidB-like acyl-CoA dehydrogenase